MTAMSNKVFGVLGIASYMSNFNADFTGNPRRCNDTYFASSVACKYSIRAYWSKIGEKVFGMKSWKKEKDSLMPRTIDERYEFLFEKSIKPKSSAEIMQDLFSCIDIINFGGTFASRENNISITGVVQFTDALNKYEDTEVIREQILSEFKNSNKEDAEQTTAGSRTITNEAHYFYGLSVNPLNYKEYINSIDDFEGYTKEAYNLLKEGCLYGVNEMQSMSKSGCENEFALFAECKDGSKISMANLQNYISFNKKDNKGIIDLNTLMEYLQEFKQSIDIIEIYTNPYTVRLKMGDIPGLSVKVYSILDRNRIIA